MKEIVRRILTVCKPDRMILFGSAATGTMTGDSEIDLLIVEPEPGVRGEEYVRIRRSLRGMGHPIDIILISTRSRRAKALSAELVILPANMGALSMKPSDDIKRKVLAELLRKPDADFDPADHLLAEGATFPNAIAFGSQ